MDSNGKTNALQRKLAGSGAGAQSADRSALRALRLSLARSATNLFDLPLAVIGASQKRGNVDGLSEWLPDDCLLIYLDGPDGAVGAAALDGALVEALIQAQTMGEVSAQSGPKRAFTETDAAMAAPLLDSMLNEAAELAQIPADQDCLQGFRFGARAEDRRSLLLGLQADRYRGFDLSLDIAAGLRKGRMVLVLPDTPVVRDQSPDTAKHEDGSFGAALLQVPAELNVVLGRLQLSLSELSAMQPGDRLTLKPKRLDQVELVSVTGDVIALCHLGQAAGARAVRINERLPALPAAGAQNEAPADMAEFAPHTHVQTDAVIDADALDEIEAPQEEPDNSDLLDLSPDEAALEITQLAGLPAQSAIAEDSR